MGWQNIFHCEWNPFGQKILKHYWPDAISYGDITKTDFNVHRGQIDIVTGGFPCQPYSVAGKRKGKEDDRHLWPEMLRAIREIQPRWVVGENVPGLLNWNGGMVLDEIKADLEAAGFEVFPPLILPACGKDAPHRRDRLWIVAHSSSNAKSKQDGKSNRTEIQRTATNEQINGGQLEAIQCDRLYDLSRTTPDTHGNKRCEGRMHSTERKETKRYTGTCDAFSSVRETWHNFPTQSPVCSGDDGIPAGLDGITISKWRKESLMAAGNGIVPQVVYEIFKAIDQVA